MSKQLRELQARKAGLIKDARALTDAAAAEQRDMNEEEMNAFDALKLRIEAASAAIDRESALIAEEARMAMLPDDSARGFVTVTDNREADPRHGFKSVGEFLKTVCHAQKPGNGIDERLLIGANRGAAVPANFGAEGSGQDGGFLVPPQFAQEIFQLSLGEDSLLPMTDNVEITGNTMAFPKDETTPWGTNGIRAYWQGEATPAAGTKPVLGLASLRLKKLMALVPVTDELLDDTNALSTYLPDKIATSIRWKTNESILFGSGTGVPMGCMSGGSTVTVAKETGQAAQTLLAQNLAKMISRLPPGSFPRRSGSSTTMSCPRSSRSPWATTPFTCLLASMSVASRSRPTVLCWAARSLSRNTPTPSRGKAMCCWQTFRTTRRSPRLAACKRQRPCTCISMRI